MDDISLTENNEQEIEKTKQTMTEGFGKKKSGSIEILFGYV